MKATLLALLLTVMQVSTAVQVPPLPSKVLIGYASTNYTNVIRAVMDDGVNIVIWAFAELLPSNEHTVADSFTSTTRKLQTASLATNLNLTAVQQTMEYLIDNNHSIIHLISFGGWNGRHLDTSLSARQWMGLWHDSGLGQIFHGIDWDYEGNDDLSIDDNVFTFDCLERMGEISRLMKEGEIVPYLFAHYLRLSTLNSNYISDEYIVTMAPPQSYLNTQSTSFSSYVNLTSPSSHEWHPFHYYGRNVYAYLLSKYGQYIDLISIQLYESYSDAGFKIYHDGMDAADYLLRYIRALADHDFTFFVDFGQDLSIGMDGQYVSLPLNKLVFGFANGWALNDVEDEKTLYVAVEQIRDAYERLKVVDGGDMTPRGFMFWTIDERGTNDVYLARGLSHILEKREDYYD